MVLFVKDQIWNALFIIGNGFLFSGDTGCILFRTGSRHTGERCKNEVRAVFPILEHFVKNEDLQQTEHKTLVLVMHSLCQHTC